MTQKFSISRALGLENLVKHLPGFEAAQLAVQQEALSHRAALIQSVRKHREAADQIEVKLSAAASALNAKASKLREQLAAIELDISENLAARGTARWDADIAVTQLQRELRSDAHEQVANFQARIVDTRELLQSNFGNARPWILGANHERPHTDGQVVAALALLLDAYSALNRIALEEADVQTAIEALRERLVNAGIQVVDSNTLLHLAPPRQKAQAYI
jgi:hypothetical protein